MSRILFEDIEDDESGLAPRFGTAIEVDFNLKNSGNWTTLKNGDRLWRLEIESPGAASINLNYDKFNVPRGAQFFVIDQKSSEYLGAFTSANVNEEFSFATGLLKTDKILLEYLIPVGIKETGQLSVSHLVHGYRDPSALLKNFGDSQGCSNNVNCSQYSQYGEVKNSVAMLLTDNNTRFCTGALVNNTALDCLPYLLTAKHCMPNVATQSSVNFIFMFNYESPTCADVDGPTSNTVQGAILRAAHADSDFALLELNDNPADYYSDIYFAGWSRENTSPTISSTIHHPSGDLKKISLELEALHSTGLFQLQESVMEKFWRVVQWDEGSTEPGSSGAPLFDQNSRLVGQLYGGQATCNGPNNTDWFGKFWYSWDQISSDPHKQLKHWLDPLDTGTTFINGAPNSCSIIASCDDGLINGNETGVDCGGSECAPCISCSDGIMNGDENDVDCGGTYCTPCSFCVPGADIILSEGFDNCTLPAGWSTSHSNATANNIVSCNNTNGIFSFDCQGGLNYTPSSIENTFAGPSTNFLGCVATLNDDNQGFNGANGSACIALPIMDLSEYTSLKLRLDYQNEVTNSGLGVAFVQIFNGFFWQQIMNVSTDENGTFERVMDQFISSSFQMEICYSDEGASAWGAAFDNILLCGEKPSSPSDCLGDTEFASNNPNPYGDQTSGGNDDFNSSGNILSSSIIANGSHVQYSAEGRIELLPGFAADNGGTFEAQIQECE